MTPHNTGCPWPSTVHSMFAIPFQVPRCMALLKHQAHLRILTLATMLAGGTLSSLKGVTFLQGNSLSSVVQFQVLF